MPPSAAARLTPPLPRLASAADATVAVARTIALPTKWAGASAAATTDSTVASAAAASAVAPCATTAAAEKLSPVPPRACPRFDIKPSLPPPPPCVPTYLS